MSPTLLSSVIRRATEDTEAFVKYNTSVERLTAAQRDGAKRDTIAQAQRKVYSQEEAYTLNVKGSVRLYGEVIHSRNSQLPEAGIPQHLVDSVNECLTRMKELSTTSNSHMIAIGQRNFDRKCDGFWRTQAYPIMADLTYAMERHHNLGSHMQGTVDVFVRNTVKN